MLLKIINIFLILLLITSCKIDGNTHFPKNVQGYYVNDQRNFIMAAIDTKLKVCFLVPGSLHIYDSTISNYDKDKNQTSLRMKFFDTESNQEIENLLYTVTFANVDNTELATVKVEEQDKPKEFIMKKKNKDDIANISACEFEKFS
jgi:hypothetical protein